MKWNESDKNMMIEKIEEERIKYRDEFHKIYAYADLSLLRLRAMYDIYTQIKNITEQTLSQVSKPTVEQLIPGKESGPIAPGILGTQTEAFLQLLDNIYILIANSRQFSNRVIMSKILPTIQSVYDTDCSNLQQIKSEVTAARLSRRKVLALFKLKEQSNMNLYNQINQMKNQGKDVSTRIPLYLKSVKELKALTKQLNAAHITYVNTVQQAIQQIRNFSIIRESTIKEFLCAAYPYYLHISSVFQKYAEYCEAYNPSWEDDIKVFVTARHLVRTCPLDKEFVPFSFTFEDSMIKPTKSIIHPTFSIPLYFGTVKHDFNGEEDNQLTVSKDERVYIYENTCHEWTLICKDDGTRKLGYVPSACLEYEEGNYTFAVSPYIPQKEGEIAVSAGELVKIVEDTPQTFQKVNGSQGIIDSYVIATY